MPVRIPIEDFLACVLLKSNYRKFYYSLFELLFGICMGRSVVSKVDLLFAVVSLCATMPIVNVEGTFLSCDSPTRWYAHGQGGIAF